MHALLTERRRSSPDGNRSLPSPSSSLMVTACCSYPMVTSGILWVLIEGAIRSPSTSLRCGAPARSSFGKTAFFQKAPRSSLDEGKPILPSRASFRRKPPEVKLSEGSRQRLSFPKDVQKKVASFGNLWRFPKEANFFRFLRKEIAGRLQRTHYLPSGRQPSSPEKHAVTIIYDDGDGNLRSSDIRSMCTHSSKAQPLANSMKTTPYGGGLIELLSFGERAS